MRGKTEIRPQYTPDQQIMSRRALLKLTGFVGGTSLIWALSGRQNTAVAAPLAPGYNLNSAPATAPALPQKDKRPENLTSGEIEQIGAFYSSDAIADFLASLPAKRNVAGSLEISWDHNDVLSYQDKLKQEKGGKSPERANPLELIAIAVTAQKFVQKTGLVGFTTATARNTGGVVEVNIQSGPQDPEKAPTPANRLALFTAQVQFGAVHTPSVKGVTNNFTRDSEFGEFTNGDLAHIAAQTFREEQMKKNEARYFFPLNWIPNGSIPQAPTYISLQPIIEGDQGTYPARPNSNLHLVGIGARMEQYDNIFYRGSNGSVMLTPYKLVGTT